MKQFSLIVFLIAAFTGCLDAACSGNSAGSVDATQCTSTSPPPTCAIDEVVVTGAENQGNIERTSFSQIPVAFTHTGGPGLTYTARPLLSDATDSGTAITEGDCLGTVTVFFAKSGEKSVNIEVNQLELNRILSSTAPRRIIYDATKPQINVLRIFPGDNTEGAGLEYSSGTTYYTSGDVTVRARVVDPAPAQTAENLSVVVVDGLSAVGQPVPSNDENDKSLFLVPLGVASEADGEYLVKLSGMDFTAFNFPDGSPANISESRLIRVVKDQTAPIVTRIEVVKNPGTPEQVVEQVPGVFIRSGRVRIRVTFSEPLQRPPTLQIQQLGNGAGDAPENPVQATFDSQLFAADPTVVEYEYSPLVGPFDTGPANLLFEQDGTDLAGNIVDVNQGAVGGGQVQRALIIDTNAPSLNRVDPENPGEVRTIPENNEKISRTEFPRQVTIIVRDYNLPDNIGVEDQAQLRLTDNASGVDFDRIIDGTEGSSTDNSGISVEITDPNEQVIQGTLVTQPPNGLIYILPTVEALYPDRTDGTAPEGTYTVKVNLVDKVGNNSVETFFFQVDNAPISGDTIRVSLEPVQEAGTEFAKDSDNGLLQNPITGKEIPELPDLVDLRELDAVNQITGFRVCSTDSSFDVTRSQVTLKARLNGPDTVARTMTTTGGGGGANPEGGACGPNRQELSFTVDTNQTVPFPNLVGFPNPASAGANIDPGARDPRFGQFDGPYLVEVIAYDEAGNESSPIRKEFLLDTTQPYTAEVFPSGNGKINSPLRHVSAILIDPHPPRIHTFNETGHVNFGSGINVERSELVVQLAEPYRPNFVQSSDLFIPENQNEVRSKLRFTHIPNSIDPTKPTFDPKDDKYRVLLEFINKAGVVTPLPNNGDADGIYRVVSTPVDNAGNSVQPAAQGDSSKGWSAFDGQANRPMEVTEEFFFLLDSIPPNMTIDNNPSTLNITGSRFELAGKTRDLSAQEATVNGGSGIHRVEYELMYLTEDGELIPPVPATENTRAKSNPILRRQTATLDPLINESNDPHVSSTKPLTVSSYINLALEERSWKINGQLPSASEIIGPGDNSTGKPANYWMSIKSYDQSGNFLEKRLKVNLSLGELPGANLLKPLPNQAFTKGVIMFEWQSIPNVESYVLHFSSPRGEKVTRAVATNGVNNPFHTEVFSLQGEYEWWVVGIDSVGNEGKESLHQKFRIDRNKPKVVAPRWVDFSPESNGKLTIGQFRLQVEFDEEIKVAPMVTFRPPATSIPAQLVKTEVFNMNSKLWQGVATIPTTATGKWDGIATIEIKYAQDMAGNVMDVNRQYNFEIDTGPSYQVKFFENPIFETEIVVVVQSSEELQAPPVILKPQGVTPVQNGMLRVGARSYSTVMKIAGSTSVKTGRLEITGSDLVGNSSTRIVTFPIASVVENRSTTVNTSLMKLEIKAGSVDSPLTLAALPRDEFEQLEQDENSQTSKSLSRLYSQSRAQEGMKRVRGLEQLFPPGAKLKKEARVQVYLADGFGPGRGLFLETGSSQPRFLSVAQSARVSFHTDTLGKLAIYEDRVPPSIEISPDFEDGVIDSRNPVVRFAILDQGSGVHEDRIRVLLGSREMEVVSLGQGQFEASYSGSLPRGEHPLEIEAMDRLANLSIQKANLVVAGPIRVSGSAFPNPARNFSVIQYDLSRPAQVVELKIYDAAGRMVFHRDSNNDLGLTAQVNRNSYRWDLDNDQGSLVKNGVYFVVLNVIDTQGRSDRVQLKLAVVQ